VPYRWLIGVMAFWVAFPAVSAGGPAYLLPIAPAFVLWAALVAYLEAHPADACAPSGLR
jgi:hypothetical protein